MGSCRVPGQLRVDVRRQHVDAARVRGGRAEHRRPHARPRPVGGRNDRPDEQLGRDAHARGGRKHDRLVTADAPGRCCRRGDQRHPRRIRAASANPSHAGDALHLPGARDQGAAAARRGDADRLHEDPGEPERPHGSRVRRSERRLLAGVSPHALRHRRLRDRQRRGGGPRAGRARAGRQDRRLHARRHVRGGRRPLSGGDDDIRRRNVRRRLRAHVDRGGRPRRHQLLRWARKRDRDDRRRVHPHAADQRALLRQHRSAVPVVLPGPLPRRRGAARNADSAASRGCARDHRGGGDRPRVASEACAR